MTLLLVLGVFLAGRAVVEPFLVVGAKPASYENDWGGPTLGGVLAVHCLPGIVAVVCVARFAVRRVGSAARRSAVSVNDEDRCSA
jgi:hypothetical protein